MADMEEAIVLAHLHRSKVPHLMLSIPDFARELPMIHYSIYFAFLRTCTQATTQAVNGKWPESLCLRRKLGFLYCRRLNLR